MDLDEYQAQAAVTDQQGTDGERRLAVALLGLAGEVGTLLTAHKKWIRDGDAYDRTAVMIEDIGDILWYLAAASSSLGVSLNDAAVHNLAKIADRWPAGASGVRAKFVSALDAEFPEHERLPSQLTIEFARSIEDPGRVIGIMQDGTMFGNSLSDNSYDDDGYRWHDVIHLSFCAVLGWSPVIRALLKRKRKSVASVDEVEDGGRAVAIEEGISAAAFDYASRNSWLSGVRAVDTSLLQSFRGMTRGLEVAQAPLQTWESALLLAFTSWRELRANEAGRIILDRDQGSLRYETMTGSEIAAQQARAAKIAAQQAREAEMAAQ